MLFIKNRQELAKLINNRAVESYPVKSKPGRKIMNTIVYDKKRNRFYKIEWGEIVDENEIDFLWYNENAEEVFLNPKDNAGWFTKKEMKNLTNKGEYKMNMEELLMNVNKNIVNINLVEKTDDTGENIVQIVGAQVGKGKTWYAMMQIIEALIRDETVLLFSMETPKEEVGIRMKKILMETRLAKEICDDFDNKDEKTKELIINDFINKADIMIINSSTMDINSIALKMKEINQLKQLDLVLIDSLQVNIESKLRNAVEVQAILKHLEDIGEELKCKVKVTVQLGSNF